MVLEYACAKCDALLESAGELQGRTVRCPHCRTLLFLASLDAPRPRYADMELGPEALLVTPVIADRALTSSTPPPFVPPPDAPVSSQETGTALGGIGAPRLDPTNNPGQPLP